jgi:hypothetical protein
MNLHKQGLPTLRVPTALDQSQRTSARPLGRSWTVRRYWLCIRVEIVPQSGHAAVGDVACKSNCLYNGNVTDFCEAMRPGKLCDWVIGGGVGEP